MDPKLDAREAVVIWSPTEAPAVTTLLIPFPRFDEGSRLTSRTYGPGSPCDDSFTFKNLDPRVTVGFPESHEGCPLAALLPFDENWPARVEAAGRARQAILGKTTARIIPKYRCRRIRSALRVHDGRAEGASYRQLAKELFSNERVDTEYWKTSALKAQVARLSKVGLRMISEDYRSLLLGGTTGLQRQRR